MIEVKNLTFSYSKDKQALHDLKFTVEDGEIFGFLGPNGSEKSTTQNNPRLLFLDEPTSGLDLAGVVLFRKIIEQECKKGQRFLSQPITLWTQNVFSPLHFGHGFPS